MKDKEIQFFRYLALLDREDGTTKVIREDEGDAMKPTGYEVIIWWSVEDRCYIAEVPELSGCRADGGSLPEVAVAVEKSIELRISEMKAQGLSIPAPRGRLLYA